MLRSFRRKNEENNTIETVCHSPTQPLYGMFLKDYNSSTCEMKEQKTDSGLLYICSCEEEECNENLNFLHSEFQLHSFIHFSLSVRPFLAISSITLPPWGQIIFLNRYEKKHTLLSFSKKFYQVVIVGIRYEKNS